MPSKNLFLWAACGGFAAARGPQQRISGAAAPPPNPYRVSPVSDILNDFLWGTAPARVEVRQSMRVTAQDGTLPLLCVVFSPRRGEKTTHMGLKMCSGQID